MAKKITTNKSKPEAVPQAAGSVLESRFNNALALLSSNKAGEAVSMFEAIATEAIEAGNFSMARAARNYISHEQHKNDAPPKADPVQEAVFMLNGKQPEAALEKIDNLIKKDSSNANFHYLKALAHAMTEQIELSAECLKKAIDLDPDLLHVYRLESEFKTCRTSARFANFELA